MTHSEINSDVIYINNDISMIMRTNSISFDKDLEIWEGINERICVLVDDVVTDFLNLVRMVKDGEDYDKIQLYSVLWRGKFSLLQQISVDFALTEYVIRLSESFLSTSTFSSQTCNTSTPSFET